VATEMMFIVEYRCPRCDAALEARSSQSYGWLRCPRCGRASLPPEHMRSPRPQARWPPGEDVLIIGPEQPGRSPANRPSSRHGNFRRIAGATALFLSLLISLLSLLDQDRISATIFALIALACLAISVYPARRRAA
jgi:DNA-directed RNA polymerase subunit RPC12/RpoP